MPSSPATKAVILARGLGTRMRRSDPTAVLDARQAAVAETGVKAMIPVGRPFLDYSLSALADAGYRDRKSTRLNSSHGYISYAVFCLKKKKQSFRRYPRVPYVASEILPHP